MLAGCVGRLASTIAVACTLGVQRVYAGLQTEDLPHWKPENFGCPAGFQVQERLFDNSQPGQPVLLEQSV